MRSELKLTEVRFTVLYVCFIGAHGRQGLCLFHLYILGHEAACLFSDRVCEHVD